MPTKTSDVINLANKQLKESNSPKISSLKSKKYSKNVSVKYNPDEEIYNWFSSSVDCNYDHKLKPLSIMGMTMGSLTNNQYSELDKQ